jgi:hypothetical protein
MEIECCCAELCLILSELPIYQYIIDLIPPFADPNTGPVYPVSGFQNPSDNPDTIIIKGSPTGF